MIIAVIVLCSGCSERRLQVQHIANPVYPQGALVQNIQGTVTVSVVIGADGKVLLAQGSGAHPLLVEAAEKNVRDWVFGPFPSVAEFPIYHTVTYVFKLEGPPLSVGLFPPVVDTYLPDRIEIKSRLFKDDYGSQRVEPTLHGSKASGDKR